jgi:hypothetical protein
LYFDLEIPPSIISIIRLLLLLDEEWEKTREKAKPPKPKMDAVVLTVLHEVLQRKLKEYPTSIQVRDLLPLVYRKRRIHIYTRMTNSYLSLLPR